MKTQNVHNISSLSSNMDFTTGIEGVLVGFVCFLNSVLV